jgi:hypothetical protein
MEHSESNNNTKHPFLKLMFITESQDLSFSTPRVLEFIYTKKTKKHGIFY